MQTPVEPRYPVRSVENALALLLLFRGQELLRVGEAADAIGVVPSTAHRLLSTLQAQGFVSQDPLTRAYAAGPVLLELGLAVIRGSGIRNVARAELEKLAETINETTHLLLRDGRVVIFIDSVESSQPLRTSSRVGLVLPAHCTSGGKALLAELSNDELRALYPGQKLQTCTPRSTKTWKQLEADLVAARRQGYALNLGESETDIHAIGVAIETPAGRPYAALTVSGPASRLSERHLRKVAQAVRAAAGNISSRLL